MPGPTVSVIIPSLGRFEPLLSTVRDLLDQRYGQLEIIVIDQNAEWPAEAAAARDALRSDIRLHWVEHFPIGVVCARNHAVSISHGELLLFVDDDVWIPDLDFVARHVTAHADPSLAIVCGRELKLHQVVPETRLPRVPAAAEPPAHGQGRALSQLLAFDRSQAVAAIAPAFSTCNGSIKRSAFLAVGGFDESFRGASYGDDADFVLRLWERGARVLYDPRPWLVHLLAPAGGLRMSDPKSRFTEYDKCLSGLIVLFRHARGSERWPILYRWVLRRSVLLRRNVVAPWRQPRVFTGLASATLDAWQAARSGPRSGLRVSDAEPVNR